MQGMKEVMAGMEHTIRKRHRKINEKQLRLSYSGTSHTKRMRKGVVEESGDERLGLSKCARTKNQTFIRVDDPNKVRFGNSFA